MGTVPDAVFVLVVAVAAQPCMKRTVFVVPVTAHECIKVKSTFAFSNMPRFRSVLL